MDDLRLEFDRGTLVCRSWPAGFDPRSLPGVRWDRRVGCWRAPAERYAAIRAALARAGIGCDDRVRPSAPPPSPPAPSAPSAPSSRSSPSPPLLRDVELRPYQAAALAAWQAAQRRGVVVLPTGSGKTRVALAAAARCGPTLFLVPTRVLVAQWRGALAELAAGPVGCYGDGERHLAALTVATFDSAARHMPAIGNCFELLVVDEVHHFAGGERAEMLRLCAAPARLGLTATPTPDGGSSLVEELIGPRVFELGIGDLRGGFLADFDHIRLGAALTDGERAAYEAGRDRFLAEYDRFRALAPGAPWASFARWAAQHQAGARALAAWRRAEQLAAWNHGKAAIVAALLRLHRRERTLLFTADNDAAYAIAAAHLVMPITADISRAERAAALRDFRAGRLRALVSARVLNEGLDVPDAAVGVLVGGALGRRERIQRLGRLLRPAPAKRALVYELVTSGTVEAARLGTGLGQLDLGAAGTA